MDEGIEFLETLPVLQRLAMAYCPAASRTETLALFALDTRLAGVVRSASEPMLAQLRLAWWRDVLAKPAGDRPEGEPLLGCLQSWAGEETALVSLVDGWEAMAVPDDLSTEAIVQVASGRADAFGALARLVGVGASADAAARLGGNWAVADIAGRLENATERAMAIEVAQARDWRGQRLPRAVRPLQVLHGLAAKAVHSGEGLDRVGPLGVLRAMRIGLLGA